MNGKLLVRIIESALSGQVDQVKILTNIMSNELRNSHPEISTHLTRLTSTSNLRGVKARVNPNQLVKPKYESGSKVHDSNSQIGDMVKINSLPELDKPPVWSDETRKVLEQMLVEHENRSKLQKGGLEPVKTVIFTGPPGVGKTITAQWLSQEMKLPLLILDLATVMNSQLGKTGNNLKAVIDYAASQPCVLLLDEFDAIAKKRDDDSDVGELKRLVTVLLQTIDTWPSSSLLIAATNHPELLDPAVWRRFEEKVCFDNPCDEQIKQYLGSLTNNKKIESLYPFFRGGSYSDIRTAINRTRKISIIYDTDLFEQLTMLYVSDIILENMTSNEKKELAVSFVDSKISQRRVAELLKISRQTVKKALLDARTDSMD
ncbi:MAG: ATP-binding protein [Photobacterium frigidiphilum]|uniref:AAA family ATPase n=1 Tax=Photobacterium frigidiphilum TaxID=264736 RepID=UPI003002F7A9